MLFQFKQKERRCIEMKQYINPGVAVSQQMATLLRSKGREFQWFKLDRELGVKSTGGGWAHKVYVLE